MNTKKNKIHTYRHTFVLRLWQEHDPAADNPDPQRIVLENPQTGARQRFQSLSQLFIFLETVNSNSKR